MSEIENSKNVQLAEDLKSEYRNYSELLDVVTSFLESSVIGVVLLDGEEKCRIFNKGSERLTGYLSSEMIGNRLPNDLFPEKKAKEMHESFMNGDPIINMEVLVNKRDGTQQEIVFNMTPKCNKAGDISGCLNIFTDNSEKKLLQKLLLQSQKMEIVGELAGGIAHDFNNLLEGILGYTNFIIDTTEEGTQLWEQLKIIEKTARKASCLTDRLLSFSGDIGEEEVVDCNTVVEEVLKLIERSIDKKIEICSDLAEDLKPVVGSGVQLEQAFLNVCLNARDAMPDGGRIILKTESIFIDNNYPRLSLDMKPGLYVRISISDTGVGMDNETKAKIFEPFYTTKKRGEGTGLGLNMVYGIIKKHGGFVNVYSEIGEGTTFSIYIPASSKKITITAEKEQPKIAPLGEGEMVLLVDDEAVVRDLGREMLEKLRYNTLIARDGVEGLSIFRKEKEKIELVVLDLVMPGESGCDLLKKIRILSPGMPILVSSGFNRGHLDNSVLQSDKTGFIQKPYSVDELGIEIYKTLHQDDADQPG
ncbi:response regulator [bacterium]|nr:response regulator [bacterium]